MSSVKRIGLAAGAVTACVTGAFAATGFGEGGGESSGFSYISGNDQGVAALGRGATASGLAEAAGKGGGGKPKVIVMSSVETVPPGQSFHEARKCPKRSVAVNGQFAPFGPPEAPEAFGVNMQGFAATSPRKWGFQFDNETADPVSTLLGAVCLKNAKLIIRGPG
jgi:hypothetical protein